MISKLKETGLDVHVHFRERFIHTVKLGAPVLFKELFATFPKSGKAEKEVISRYETWAVNHKKGGVSATNFQLPDKDALFPDTFFGLAQALGNNGTDFSSAWLYIRKVLEQEGILQPINQNYTTHVLQLLTYSRIANILNRKDPSTGERSIQILERLAIALEANMNEYNYDCSPQEKIESLAMRISNAIWAHSEGLKKQSYDPAIVTQILNELQGSVHM